MPKDKKKKVKDDKGKKRKKNGRSGTTAAVAKGSKKAARSLQALTQNPIVADVVAAALVAMASALKDTDKARKLADQASDELGKMAKTNAKQGSAMWDMALDIGRRTLDTLAGEDSPRGKAGKSR
ncbi:MAG: hypothetical protein ACJ8FT_08910 [Sphingomonas sp.]